MKSSLSVRFLTFLNVLGDAESNFSSLMDDCSVVSNDSRPRSRTPSATITSDASISKTPKPRKKSESAGKEPKVRVKKPKSDKPKGEGQRSRKPSGIGSSGKALKTFIMKNGLGI